MKAWGAHPAHSVGFMSRVEIGRHQWHRPAPSRRAFLEIVPAGESFRIFGIHLSAVHSNWTERRRVRELRAVLASIEKHQHGFHVLAGDFNTLAPGETLDLAKLPLRLRTFVYLTGREMIFRMREEYKAREGARFTLKAFHSEVLSRGTIAPGLIAREMFGGH